MNRSIFRPISFLMFLFALALTACTATLVPTVTLAPPTSTPIPTATLPPPAVTSIPPTTTFEPTTLPSLTDGSYTTIIEKEDYIHKLVDEADICEHIGTYTLTLAGERWFLEQIAEPGCDLKQSRDSGSWIITGENNIAFHTDFIGCGFNYIYSWRFEGSELRFTKVQDDCMPREIYFTSHPWTKQAETAAIPIQYRSQGIWEDATAATIGTTAEWSNMVELADLNNDGLVDLLFANGGGYAQPGKREFSRIFLNQGNGKPFKEITESVFGSTRMFAKVIKVRDVNGDEDADILVGTSYNSQSQLYLGDGTGNFTDVTATHLPGINAKIIDAEFGDVDGDGDLDLLLADWGTGNTLENEGGRTLLWLNDGAGHFSDATQDYMPDVMVRFAWDMELVDIDNDYDLDLLVSCKNVCEGSFLFENDGQGHFRDVTAEKFPPAATPYDFVMVDLNADNYLDLILINEVYMGGRIFINDQSGGFVDETAQRWPISENLVGDDAMAAILDYDSDGDADVVIGNLWRGSERLLVNDGSGNFVSFVSVFSEENTPGTLGIAVADLNGDNKLDVVMAQGENQDASDDKVFLGSNIQPDTAPPVITLVEQATTEAGQPIQIRARMHDNKSPTMPHDWQSIVLKWTADGQTTEIPMQWYGEYLWRAVIDSAPAGGFSYQVCATDASGNQACSESMQAK